MNARIAGVLAAAIAAASGSLFAQSLTFTGTTDKDPLTYKLNETIKFTVTLVDKDSGNAAVKGKELRWTLKGDDASLNTSGTATSDSPLTVTTALSKPGFVRLTVNVYENGKALTGKTEKFDGGAGADVMNIGEWAAPSDFAAFWKNAVESLYSKAYAANLTAYHPADGDSAVEYYLFDIPTFDGEKHATGILAKPAGAKTATCGILACMNGYGWGRTPLPSASEVKKGNIVLQIARHGEDPVNDDDAYYTQLQQEMGVDKSGAQKGYCWRNNNYAVADTDYYKMLMRDLRAIQYAKTMKEWNGQELRTNGGSMGGYQALACAALDSDVTGCTVSIPWCADLSSGVKYGRMTGWRPDWTTNLDYVDLKNLAKLVKCPVTLTAGLGDYVCPPSGEILLYKNLPDPKQITFTQNQGHDGQYGVGASSYVLRSPAPKAMETPRSLTWVGGGSSKNWSVLGNWQDDAGKTNAVPRNGDTLTIPKDPGTACKNDIAGLMPYQLKLAGYQATSSSGEPITFDSVKCYGIYNQGYLHYDFPTKLIGTNVTVYSSSHMVCRNWFASGDGNPCGVRKIGSQYMHLNCTDSTVTSAENFKGFKYIEIAEGGLGLGFNGSSKVATCLPADMVITFAAKDTTMLLRDRVVLKNLTLRETGTAVRGTHKIVGQNDGGYMRAGTLELTGLPPDDVTTFTGSLIDCTSLKWTPDSAVKEFVFDGGVSTTTGGLHIAKGTVRIRNGATFTALKTLEIGAAGKLSIEAAPSKPFMVKAATIAQGGKIYIAAGTTLTVGGLISNNARQQPGIYGAGGQTVDWIEGGGSVEVEGIISAELIWVGGVTPRNWNNPNCWTNVLTGQHDIPVSGDSIKLINDANVGCVNNLSGLVLKQIKFGGGYMNPSGNEITLPAGSAGLRSDGYMFYNLPTRIEGTELEFYASSMTDFRDGGIYSTDGKPCGFKKTGNGQLALSPTDKSKWTNFKYITHTAGSLCFCGQQAGDTSRLPGLDINITGSSVSIDVHKHCVLTNLTIRQTGSGVTGTHNIGARLSNNTLYPEGKLEIVGTPDLITTEFSGQVNNPASFKWNPETADRVFCLTRKNGVSDTTNEIEVARGTLRIANGGTCTALSRLALTGGEGTCFDLATQPNKPFKVKVLFLETGLEKLRVSGGAVINAEEAYVNGLQLAKGVYEANGIFAQTVDWMAGAGFLCVGGATPPDVPSESATTTSASWTANGGSDTRIGNGSNWGAVGSTTLPDFTTGSLVATFGTGSAAQLDRKATFKGVYAPVAGAFSFTKAAEGNNWAFVGSGGIVTAGKGTILDWGWPLYMLGSQTWWINKGDTLNVNAPIVDNGGTLKIDGGGTVNFRVPSDFVSTMEITNTEVHAYADNAFGSGIGMINVDFKTSKLHLHGVTLDRNIRNLRTGTDQAADGSSNELVIAPNTTNVINGDLDLGRTQMQPSFGKGSVLRVKGHLKRDTTSWLYLGDNGTLILDQAIIIDGGSAIGMKSNKTLYLNAPNNDVGSVWFWLMGENGRLCTTVPFALTHEKKTYIRDNNGTVKNFVWDLCGCDQGVTLWGVSQSSTTTITSEKPAQLYLKHDVVSYSNSTTYESTNYTCWAGAAGVNFVGSKFFQMNGVSTSTGTVQVTSGRLEIGPKGTWANASTALLSGGELRIQNRKAFGKRTAVRFDGDHGTLNLDYRGSMGVGELFLYGQKQPIGTYGSLTSTAQYKDEHFIGNGVLRVGDLGTFVIIR